MQAIEFESTVRDQAIPLPTPGMLSPGQSVRVVVMFEDAVTANSQQPRVDIISALCANPLVLPDFLTLSRDETHER
jgi:hypothetical protein